MDHLFQVFTASKVRRQTPSWSMEGPNKPPTLGALVPSAIGPLNPLALVMCRNLAVEAKNLLCPELLEDVGSIS